VQDADVESDGRQRWWEAVGRGFRYVASDDDAGRDAAALLERVMFDQAEHLPRRRATEVEPLREADWRRAAGLSNTTFVATADELAEVEAAIEAVLAPYVLRKSERVGAPGARNVRMLRYVLPEAPPVADGPDGGEPS
jgi:hypothetical protein